MWFSSSLKVAKKVAELIMWFFNNWIPFDSERLSFAIHHNRVLRRMNRSVNRPAPKSLRYVIEATWNTTILAEQKRVE